MAVPLLVVGTLCFMSIGLLAGAITKTTEGAVNIANFMVLPMAFLSGSFFPLDGAPQWLQTFSQLLPLQAPQRGHARRDGARRAAGPRRCCRWRSWPASRSCVTLIAARLFRWETD